MEEKICVEVEMFPNTGDRFVVSICIALDTVLPWDIVVKDVDPDPQPWGTSSSRSETEGDNPGNEDLILFSKGFEETYTSNSEG